MQKTREKMGALHRPTSKNDEMQERAKAKRAAAYPPGSIILSADKRTQYKVLENGSWKKLTTEQKEGEFDKIVNQGKEGLEFREETGL